MATDLDFKEYEVQVRSELANISGFTITRLAKLDFHGFIHGFRDKGLKPKDAAKKIYILAGPEMKRIFKQEDDLAKSLDSSKSLTK
jgi:hypothetical protein